MNKIKFFKEVKSFLKKRSEKYGVPVSDMMIVVQPDLVDINKYDGESLYLIDKRNNLVIEKHKV